jgi:hypothetical protein
MSTRTIPEVCEIHGLPLDYGLAEIAWGLPAFSEPYELARRTIFPHSRLFSYQGCVIDDSTHMPVRYCPRCREAESAWQEPPEPRFEDTF